MKDLHQSIICFPSVPWNHNWERQHELIYRLSQCTTMEVYVNAPYGMINHNPITILKKVLQASSGVGVSNSNPILANMKMVGGSFIPLHYLKLTDAFNERLLLSRIPCDPAESIVFATYVNGFIFNYFKKGKLKILDLAQRRQFIPELSPKAKDLEKRAVEEADLVFTDNCTTQNDYLSIRPDIIHLPTGVDTNRFRVEPSPLLKKLKAENKIIAGYIGTDLALDYTVLLDLIKNFPQVDFVLVGKYQRPESNSLHQYKNVHLIGPVPSAEVAQWYTGLDIGLIPYQINKRNEGIFPTKFLEYMAAGSPVLSSALPDVKALANEAVELYTTANEAVKGFELLLNSFQQLSAPAKALAQRYTWDRQFEIFSKEIYNRL